MAFEDVWNPAYEGLPADNENISLGAGRIQDFKTNVRERANIDHSWGDTLDNGQHNKISFNISTSNPATSGSNGYLFTKIVSSNTELFWEDSSGNVVQLTNSGSLNTQSFPSGTVMSFLQAAAPTGWTINNSFDDQLVRLVNDGSGGGTGGSWSISGVTYSGTTGVTAADLAAHTHGINDSGHSHGVTDGGHTHTVPFQIADSYGSGGNGAGASGTSTSGNSTSGISVNSATSGISTQTAGSGGGHDHSYSGSVSGSSWRPAYVAACVGTKN